MEFKKSIHLQTQFFGTLRPGRLVVRTPGFHPGNRGSIPRRATKLIIMANHKSALKRIRQSESRRLLNKYQHKTARNAIKKIRAITKKKNEIEYISAPFILEKTKD